MEIEPECQENAAGSDPAAAGSWDVFECLKEETAPIHRQIEERIPLFRADFDLQDYGRLVERFYGFWAPLEARLSGLTFLREPELDLEGRLKSYLLCEDLRTLGRDPATVRQCGNLPVVDTLPRSLGCLYVLEGSSLGAVIISRHLEKHLDLRAHSGASFFNAYGEAVGERWADFRKFVRARVHREDAGEIVDAAVRTFQCFYAWLGHGDAGGHEGAATLRYDRDNVAKSPNG